MSQPRQPFLHDLVITLAAPTQVLSDRAGPIGIDGSAVGAQGVLHADVRVLSALQLTVDDLAPEHIATRPVPGIGAGEGVVFSYVLRQLAVDQPGQPDPQLRLDRERRVEPGRVSEALKVTSVFPHAVSLRLAVTMAYDLAPIAVIKVGDVTPPREFPPITGAEQARWRTDDIEVDLHAPGAEVALSADRRQLMLGWTVELPARGSAQVEWTLDITDQGGVVQPAASTAMDAVGLARDLATAAGGPGRSGDYRLRAWLERSLADLNGLRMATRVRPDDTFFAAGSPWYLTLFGRDSLWAARMLLPLDPAYALGTLRTLAGLAGTTLDANTAEEPGKIPHELRREGFTLGDVALPPLYYGTIDATPLWICLLHDVWRAGVPIEEVAALLPTLEAALRWMVAYADHDGFLSYLDASGHGLANQGWKDSADAVRFADGSIAVGPVALCEVQGYVYEAAMNGGALLDYFARPDGDRYRTWAAQLADRFRGHFWCGTGPDRFPALALDGQRRPVDSLTSNIGHLLGTGLLNADEEQTIARHLSGPELDSGWGLRTMSAAAGGFSPLSYHCGSVWPHDTAIAILGLYRAGLPEYAGGLIEGLLRASVTVEQRLPELWSGDLGPVPYAAACRPHGRRPRPSWWPVCSGPRRSERHEMQDAPSVSSRRQA